MPRENIRIEVCVSEAETAKPIFPASTCGILSQDRRHKFIPLDSSCCINRTSAGTHGSAGWPSARFLSFTLVYARLDPRACTRADRNANVATLSSNQQKPATASYGIPRFAHNHEKTLLQYFTVSRLLNPW